MKQYKICVRKTYEKNGEEKVAWPEVGTMVHFPESERGKEGFKIEIPIFGQPFFVFERVDRDGKKPEKVVQTEPEEINPLDVPF